MESENQVKFYFGIVTLMLAFIIIVGGFILAVIRYQKRLYLKQQELLMRDAQHKKELLLSCIESAETERMQIAKDIHDEIGSIFSTLSISIDRIGNATAPQAELLLTSKNLVQTGIDSVRRISHAIVPFELELLGLEQTLENYFETLRAVSGLSFDFENAAPLDRLSISSSLALYRIAQELCSNSIKYAKAGSIQLFISADKDWLEFKYRDDGIGTDLKTLKNIKGIGLKNIESRVILMSGEVAFTSDAGKGFACRVSIPLKNNSVV